MNYVTIVIAYPETETPQFRAHVKLGDIELGEHEIAAVHFGDALRDLEEIHEGKPLDCPDDPAICSESGEPCWCAENRGAP